MQGPTRTAARGHGKVFLALFNAFLFIGSGHRMLEPGGVSGVSGDGYIHFFQMVDGHAFPDVIGTEAAYFCPASRGECSFLHHGQGAFCVIKLGFYIGKAIDPGNDIGGILSQSVENNQQRFPADLVGRVGNADGAFSSCKGLVSGQKGKTVCFFGQEHCRQVAVADTHLAVFSNRAGNTEGLQTDSQG